MHATAGRTSRTAMFRAFALSTALILVLTACAGSVDGPVIEGSRRTDGTDALVEGTLQIEDGCLYLGHPDTDERYPVIWPNGTSWDEDESGVRLPDGTLVHEGNRVSGGGGYPYVFNLGRYTNSEGQELARECVDNTYDEIAVFNSSEDIEVQR